MYSEYILSIHFSTNKLVSLCSGTKRQSLLDIDMLLGYIFPEVYILLIILNGLPHIYGYVGHGK